MSKPNKINVAYYYQELFQWRIQATHTHSVETKTEKRPDYSWGKISCGGVLDWGVQETDKINTPKYPDRKKEQRQNHVYIQNEMHDPLFLDSQEVNNVPMFLLQDAVLFSSKTTSVLCVFKRHTQVFGFFF